VDTRDLLATEPPPTGNGEEQTKVGVRLFGPIEVEHAGRGVGPRQLGGRKAKQLLEILLLARGRDTGADSRRLRVSLVPTTCSRVRLRCS